ASRRLVVAKPYLDQPAFTPAVENRIEFYAAKLLFGNAVRRQHHDRAAVAVPREPRQQVNRDRASRLRSFFQSQTHRDAPSVTAKHVPRVLYPAVVHRRRQIGRAKILVLVKLRPLGLIRSHRLPPSLIAEQLLEQTLQYLAKLSVDRRALYRALIV